jgi:predicted transcriptional regulator
MYPWLMNLREYIDQHPRERRREVRQMIADALGVTEPCVRHYANGTRSIPSRHLIPIVEATRGVVSLVDLLGEFKAA